VCRQVKATFLLEPVGSMKQRGFERQGTKDIGPWSVKSWHGYESSQISNRELITMFNLGFEDVEDYVSQPIIFAFMKHKLRRHGLQRSELTFIDEGSFAILI
jgi:hypothetical protein